MKRNKIMYILILLCSIVMVLAQRDNAYEYRCPANAHFVRCGSSCFPTCENYLNPPTECSLDCYQGCQCNPGYVLTVDRHCVLPEACSNEDCPANSHYTTCGTACPLTCANYRNPPQVCVLMCYVGCQCNRGYVLAEDGSCILPEYCPSTVEEDACNLPVETGPCKDIIYRYGFDSRTRQCRRFIYGGCEGNGNNFRNKAECETVCLLPVECREVTITGPCRAERPGFFYNPVAQQCETFWSGCIRNANNFPTRQECENFCRGHISNENSETFQELLSQLAEDQL